jgi:hypothetical protein
MLGLPPPNEGRVVVRFGAAEVGPFGRTVVVAGTDGPRECRGGRILLYIGLGVVPGSNVRLFAGVIGGTFSFTGALVSLSDGDNGLVCTVLVSLFGGGVAIVGLEIVVADVDASDNGEGALKLSVASSGDGFLLARICSILSSANRSFSIVISASTFKSPSSSRNRCVSIRSVSRSASPFLISSSCMTPRSMIWLYFCSMSSSEDV